MNPMTLMKLKSAIDSFEKRHSKFVKFLQAMKQTGFPEGSVLEVSVKMPDGKEYVSNIKITAEDTAFFSNIQ